MRSAIRAFSMTAAFALACVATYAADPWVITDDVVITEPTDVGDIIVALDGSLTVRDVPEPGLRVTGSIYAVHNASIRFENSVIQFMNTYHGQYALAGIEQATIEVIECDYRVPNRVQHALIIFGDGEMVVEDTDFSDVQLISAGNSRLSASRLTGNFEVLVQDDSTMELEDIPRTPGEGRIWVWVEFPSGSIAEYTPPMPGFVSSWTFPPPGSHGIDQSVVIERCEAMLWPMLVRENAHLTLRDIPEDNWIVVGLYLPESTTVEGLTNNLSYDSSVFSLNQELTLVNASIDTWNLYPQRDARIRVRDSLIGEILSFGRSRVEVERTTIDGSGGFLGARDQSQIVLWNSTVTCTIEATHDGTVELHNSVAEPYPQDVAGSLTRFGAYDHGRLLADQTPVNTIPVLGGDGMIGVTFIVDPPREPPSEPATLWGSVGLFSLGGGPVLEGWRIEARERLHGQDELIASGDSSIEEGVLGVWSSADPGADYVLRIVLTDTWGRTLVGGFTVLGDRERLRRVDARRAPRGERIPQCAAHRRPKWRPRE
jgi:hypothetical protein